MFAALQESASDPKRTWGCKARHSQVHAGANPSLEP
jgi:hypothetical protein